MKRLSQFTLTAIMLLTGCFSHMSSYDYMENWLIRDDAVRAFAIPSDLIYVQNDLYTKLSNIPMMQDYARMEVGYGKFSGFARVFSPLVASSDDMEAALKWYFKYHHKKNRPFIFIGEGEGGRLLKEYEQNDADGLRKKGLAASYYTDSHRKGFVTPNMIEDMNKAVARVRFRNIWDREMPEEMLSK